MPSSRDAAARRRHQAHDRERERRLAAAGFADETEALARLHVEVDAVDRLKDARSAAQAEEPPPTLKWTARSRTESSSSAMMMAPHEPVPCKRRDGGRRRPAHSVACVAARIEAAARREIRDEGTTPAISCSCWRPRRARVPSRGSDVDQALRVGMCAASRRRRQTTALSTSRPAYITPTGGTCWRPARDRG